MALNTGNPFLDALGGTPWNRNRVDYFFDNSGPGGAWTDGEQSAFIIAALSWMAVANITLLPVGRAEDADMFERKATDAELGDDLGGHTTPDASTHIGLFNTDRFWTAGAMWPGGTTFATFVHEIGHAIGLAHPHDNIMGTGLFPGVDGLRPDGTPILDGNGNLDLSADRGDNDLNTILSTVMSYNVVSNVNASADWGFTATPMAFDIAAVQLLYGAAHDATMDNVYTLRDANARGTAYRCIWDTGGVDTIRYDGARNATIDLRPAHLQNAVGGGGFLSSAQGVQGGFTIAADVTGFIPDVNGEGGVVIENGVGGSGNDTLVGNAARNVLTGNNGHDHLNGFGGADVLDGGLGNDEYVVDHAEDVVRESSLAGGYDKVISYANSYDLKGTFVERLEFKGTGDFVGSGNGQGNVLIGGTGADMLLGADGNDTLDGLGGADILLGGSGDDVYIVRDASDHVSEERFFFGTDMGGNDTVQVWLRDYTLGAFVENLTFLNRRVGFTAQVGVGNGLNNIMTAAANRRTELSGLDGADLLFGGSRADTLLGGGEDDRLWGDAGSDNLDGGEDSDWLRGAAGNDQLSGGVDGVRDVLFGGENDDSVLIRGADEAHGGFGIDTAIFAGGAVLLDAAAGTGEIAGQAFTLAEFETYLGTDQNDSVAGADHAETISLGGGNDTLRGRGGADLLDGGAGSDLLDGGADDDTYRVDDVGDTVAEEPGGGVDLVEATVSGVTLGTNVENLHIAVPVGFGGGQYTGTGNELGNRMSGEPAFWFVGFIPRYHLLGLGGEDTLIGGTAPRSGDTLDGGEGDDDLFGLDGNDVLRGGLGTDVLDGGFGRDVADYGLATGGVSLALGSGGTAGEALGDTFVGVEGVLGSAFADTVEGNGVANRIEGRDGDDALDGAGGADTLDGGAGADRLDGGAGNDRLRVDQFDTHIVGGDGVDTADLSAVTVADPKEWWLWVELAPATGSAFVGTGTGDTPTQQSELLTSVENFVGSATAYTYLYGDGRDNVFISGGAGVEFRGRGGDDTFIGSTRPAGDLWDFDDSWSNWDYVIYEEAEGSVVVDVAAGTASGADGNDTFSNIEIFWGSAHGDTLLGGDGRVAINGAAGDDVITGRGGDEILVGDEGNDTLTGGGGDDEFTFQNSRVNLHDTITDFGDAAGNQDILRFENAPWANFEVLAASGAMVQQGQDVVITWGANDEITLQNVQLAALDRTDFVFMVL